MSVLSHHDLIHDSIGADLFVEQLDDLSALATAAHAAYGRPVLRIAPEGGDLGVTIHARGVEEETFYCAGHGLWTNAYGQSVRWETLYRDELPVAVQWVVIG